MKKANTKIMTKKRQKGILIFRFSILVLKRSIINLPDTDFSAIFSQ